MTVDNGSVPSEEQILAAVDALRDGGARTITGRTVLDHLAPGHAAAVGKHNDLVYASIHNVLLKAGREGRFQVDETTTPVTITFLPQVTVVFGTQEAFVAIGPGQSSYHLRDLALALEPR